MTFTAHEALQWIEADLGAVPESTSSQMDILNQAGQQFIASRTWRVYEASTTIATTAGQDYIDLPADFRSEISVVLEGGSSNRLRKASPEEINEIQARDTNPYPRVYDFQHRVASSVMLPILRLAPTPTAVETIYLRYNTDWVELATPGDTVQMIHWLKPLYRQYVIAFARGILENEDSGTARLEAELTAVRNGQVFTAASMRDARISRGRGYRRRGFVESANYPRNIHPYLDGTTLPPS